MKPNTLKGSIYDNSICEGTNEIFYVYYKLCKPFNALWIESFYDFILFCTDKLYSYLEGVALHEICSFTLCFLR